MSSSPGVGREGEHLSPEASAASTPLLRVRSLSVGFGDAVAVDDVSIDVLPGERVALVGESGSGKSTVVRAILGMLPSTARVEGSIEFEGVDLDSATEQEWQKLRGSRIGFVPQDPLASLNPLMRVGDQVAESPSVHRTESPRRARESAVALLERVGLSRGARNASKFPHQLSGGMRQRALIAAGIAGAPALLLADEPTSALDVTVQKRILDLLDELSSETSAALLLVTHDLGVAHDRADRILVMKNGRIVEQGDLRAVFAAPQDDYTRTLLSAVPRISDPGIATVVTKRTEPVLQADGLTKTFHSRTASGRRVAHLAVNDVSFALHTGETLAIVGESGSGKSTTARIVLGLTAPDEGSVRLDGTVVTGFGDAKARALRPTIQAVFQDPASSIDPRFTVARAISQPLALQGIADAVARRARVVELIDQVGLPASVIDRRVTELSGGQKQRVAIARALAPSPSIVVCDEPVSALDVLVQEQALDLLTRLQSELGVSYLFITHDLGVVRRIAHRVLVMQNGRIVEQGDVSRVLLDPQSPYTAELLEAVPGEAA